MRRFLAVLGVLILIGFGFTCLADAESPVSDQTLVFILCNPETHVNVRQAPKPGAEKIGRAYLGDSFTTDGVIKNGFIHVTDCPYEFSHGWISIGFITYDSVDVSTAKAEISANGRVACRKSIGGKRQKWLKPGQAVTAYAVAGEWAITDLGFIQTRFLSFVP